MADSEQAAQDSLPEDNCPVVELVQRDGQPCLDVSTQIWMAKSWAVLSLVDRLFRWAVLELALDLSWEEEQEGNRQDCSGLGLPDDEGTLVKGRQS